MKSFKFIIILLFSYGLLSNTPILNAQSNAAGELSAKAYNQIAFLTTHNAFNNAEENFTYPNQDYSITRQLVDGVRALMLDVYEVSSERYEYHSFSALGKKPFVDDLIQIKQFLDNNPNEVITLILECYTSANNIETDLKSAGLHDYLFSKNADKTWPTIAEMISNGKRLVVFSDKNDATSSQSWYHYVWKYAVETSFEVTDVADFNYSFNRGNVGNTFFILNHFVVSKTLGVGSRNAAIQANTYTTLSERIKNSETKANKFPNFVVVDFYNLGDCVSVINEFNGLSNSLVKVPDSLNLKVYPVPTNGMLQVEMSTDFTLPFTLNIFSSSGQKLTETICWQYKTQINLNRFNENNYYLQCLDIK